MTTHPLAPSGWPRLRQEVTEALLDLPADALLDLTARDLALTATWLLPGRVLLEVSGAPPGRGPALRARGWRPGRPGCWHLPCGAGVLVPDATRSAAAAEAGAEVVGVLRLLAADPADVEVLGSSGQLPDATPW